MKVKVETYNYVNEERANKLAKLFREDGGWGVEVECLTLNDHYVVYADFHGDDDYDIAVEFVDRDIYFRTVGGREIHWETMVRISKAVTRVYGYKGVGRVGDKKN